MTQVSLGDCQHAHFSPTFFTWFQNDFTWSRIFINWPALQAVLADVQFFTHPVIRTSSRITSTKSFFPFVQGKQGGKQTAMKSLWDALHRCSSHLPSCVSGYTLLHYHGIILFFSRPLFAPVFLLACFLSPWLAFFLHGLQLQQAPLPTPKMQLLPTSSVILAGAEWLWPACKHAGEGEKSWGVSNPHCDGQLAEGGSSFPYVG